MRFAAITDQAVPYIPSYNGNEKLPASEQVVFWIKPLTLADEDTNRDMIDAQKKAMEGGDEKDVSRLLQIAVKKHEKKMFIERVEKIDNLFIGDVEITSGKVWEDNEKSIPWKLMELRLEVITALYMLASPSEEEVKN